MTLWLFFLPVKAENYLSKHADEQLRGLLLGFSVAQTRARLSWCSMKRKCKRQNLFVKHKKWNCRNASEPACRAIQLSLWLIRRVNYRLAESCATSRSLVIELIDSNCDDAHVSVALMYAQKCNCEQSPTIIILITWFLVLLVANICLRLVSHTEIDIEIPQISFMHAKLTICWYFAAVQFLQISLLLILRISVFPQLQSVSPCGHVKCSKFSYHQEF